MKIDLHIEFDLQLQEFAMFSYILIILTVLCIGSFDIVYAKCNVVEYPDRNEVVCTDANTIHKSDAQRERDRLDGLREDQYNESLRQKQRELDEVRYKCKKLEQRVMEQQFIAPANAVLSQYKAVCSGHEYNSVPEKEDLCRRIEQRMNNIQFVKSLETNTAIDRAMCQ
jgi:hypothetical protein